MKILLVEPSEKIKSKLEEALKKVRMDALTTEWAEEALTILEKQQIDAVMIRSNLSGMSASAFIREVRKSKTLSCNPVILVYGKLDAKKRIDYWRSGADDVIEMPFVLPEVLLRLNLRARKGSSALITDSGFNYHHEEQDEIVEESFPFHGNVETRPIPQCLGTLFRIRATGVIRFIEGKHIRAFYLENGFIRGAESSRKDENLQRLMLKWLEFPGEAKKHFKALPESSSDKEAARTARSLCGIQDESIDAIAVRYMHYVIQGAIHMSKGEFDWTPDEKADDMLLVKFRGLHPVHLLLTVVRDTSPTPDYHRYIATQDYYLAPAVNHGLLRDTFRLTAPEMCVTALTASGITIHNWLKQAEIVLPYANAFIYIMLAFKVFKAVERSELTADEIAAVTLPPVQTQDIEPTVIDVVDDEKPAKTDTPEPTPDAYISPKVSITPSAPPARKENKPLSNDDYEGVTEVDLRPLRKRILSKPNQGTGKSMLDREMEQHKQATGSHTKYQAIKERMAKLNRRQSINPKALELYKLAPSALEKGHTWDTHPALIYFLVMKLRKTGILKFTDAASETKLYWQHGRLVYAKSDKPSLRIDEVLFTLGMINEDQKAAAENLWEQYGGMRSGTGLFRQNLVSIMDLTEAVKEQIRMIISDVCNMPAGDYVFTEGPLPQSEYIAFDVSTERIVVQGIRGMEDLGNLSRVIPDLNVKFCQTAGASERAQEVHLEGIDIIVLNRFRKSNTVKSAFAGLDLSLQKFKNSLVGLYILDLLELQDNAQ